MLNEAPRPTSLLSTEYKAAVLPIIYWPDARLHKKCEDVQDHEFDDALRTVVASMVRTMKENDGIGLAAPQVGVLRNIITIDVPLEQQLPSKGTETPSYQPVSRPFTLINPRIIEEGEQTFTWDEGCLSVPGYFEARQRPKSITVEYRNDDGQYYTSQFTDLYAFAVQHEIDHLEGKVFVDPLSRLKQDRIKKKIQKTLNRR